MYYTKYKIPMKYNIVDGKIQTNAFELNIVHHCNLSCKGCSHLSPIMSKEVITSEEVLRNLSILARYLSPRCLRVVGGEPLLHPNLIDILRAIKASMISPTLRVVTNGTLLKQTNYNFWELVDEVHVSIYPEQELSQDDIYFIKEQASSYQVNVNLKYFYEFRESYSEIGTKDMAFIQRIYNTCKISHAWHCHTMYAGHFFKCPQSLFLSKLASKSRENVFRDALKIEDTANFFVRLRDYLESSVPLASCSNCLGTIGNLFPHEQAKRQNWRSTQEYSSELLADFKYLEEVEVEGTHADNDREPYLEVLTS